MPLESRRPTAPPFVVLFVLVLAQACSTAPREVIQSDAVWADDDQEIAFTVETGRWDTALGHGFHWQDREHSLYLANRDGSNVRPLLRDRWGGGAVLAFVRSRGYLLVSTAQCFEVVYLPQQGRPLRTECLPQPHFWDAPSPDGALIASVGSADFTGGDPHTVRFVDAATRAEVGKVEVQLGLERYGQEGAKHTWLANGDFVVFSSVKTLAVTPGGDVRPLPGPPPCSLAVGIGGPVSRDGREIRVSDDLQITFVPSTDKPTRCDPSR